MVKEIKSDSLIFFVCATLALIGYYFTLNYNGMLMWDEAEYAVTARQISQGLDYTNSLRPPLMGTIGAISISLSGKESDFLLKLPIPLFALCSGILLFLKLFPRHSSIGVVAASSLLFMPSFWIHTSSFLSEIPFLFFFTAAIIFFYEGLYKERRQFHYAWLFTGFAFLTRYTSLLLGIIFIFYIIYFMLTERKNNPLKVLFNRDFLLSPLWCVLTLIPWFINQHFQHGDFTIGFKQASRQLAIYLPNVSMPWHYYLSNLPIAIGIVSCIFCLIGSYFILKSKDRFGIHALITASFIIIWFSCFRYKEIRLFLSALPFLAIIAGFSIPPLLSFCKTPDTKFYLKVIIVCLLAFNGYNANYNTFINSKTLGYPTLIDAMNYLKVNSEPQQIVMGSSTPQIKWYSGMQTISIPQNLEKFKNSLDEVDWIVMVNYEKGQPAFIINQVLNKITPEIFDPTEVQIFQTPAGFTTIIAKSSFIKLLL